MRRVVLGALHIGTGRVLRMGASLLFQVGAARFLGAAGYGALSHALSGAALAQQATDLGVGPATSVGVARSRRGASLTGEAGVVLRRGALARTVLSLLLVATVVAMPGPGARLFGPGMVGWGTALALVAGWAAFVEFVLVGLGWTRSLVSSSLALYALPAVAALGAVLLGRGPDDTLATLTVVTLAGVVAVSAAVAATWRSGQRTPPEEESGPPFRLLPTAGSLAAVTFGAVVILRAPVAALGSTGDAVATGLLGASVALVERGGVVGTALGLSAGPAMAGWMGEPSQVAQAVRVARTGSVALFVAAAALVLAGPAAVRLVLGPEYEGLVALLPWVAAALFLQGAMQTVGGLLDYGGWSAVRALALATGALVVLGGLGAVGRGAAAAVHLVTLGLLVPFLVITVAAWLRSDGAPVRRVLAPVLAGSVVTGLFLWFFTRVRGL